VFLNSGQVCMANLKGTPFITQSVIFPGIWGSGSSPAKSYY
jgi:hypothetical protein